MAGLSAKDDSFIALLLDLSGRARVSDLTSLPPEAASSVLQQYAAAHPEKNLEFDGQVLSTVRSATPAPPATPPQADVAPVPPPSADSFGMVDIGGPPPAELSEMPAGLYPPPPSTTGAVDIPAPVPDAVAPYGVPVVPGLPGEEAQTPQPFGEPYPVQDLAGGYAPPQTDLSPEWGAEQPTYPPPSPMPDQEQGWEFPQEESSDFFDLAPTDTGATTQPVAWYWWFAVLLAGFPGAFLAWFLNRGRPGAKAFLYVAIGLFVVFLAAVALLFFLPGIVGSMIPVQVPPVR